ncbi:C-type lectin domain family 4 member G-like isoform X4 [Micropterus salmoides]|uniref:C-type lectin domain family 4 member G-like isoform X4 n=1 Tax=Micropterus salmoides TaxID=27706 RepID=UPI0018ED10CE|nr:C-type lectin domain family 4 member G-like isoform X4 [Micropterus salmoides]
MAEEEVSYASVVFKTNKRSPPEGLLPDKKTNSRGRCYQQVACCLGILCVILLLGIIAVCVYVVTLNHQSEPNQLKENQTILLALNGNLTNQNNKLSSENEKLRREHNNLRVQLENLTQAYTVLKSNITNLSAENQNLTSQNTKLSAENQNLTSQNTKLSAENQNLTSQKMKLETQRNNLTEQIRNMETKWNELNVSRAQWSIDAYCPKPKNQNRQCKACQDGWLPSQSSCYAINDPDVSGQKTWEEARENCTGKISDLVVIADQTEKTFISNNSWGSSGTKGYWIGLRAEDGKWKWVDGSVLTENSWIQQPATNGQCVISVETEGWKSVSCGARNRWICKKKALSL